MLANTLAALIDIQALQNRDAEDRYITDGVSWHDYEVLLAKRGDSPEGHMKAYIDCAISHTCDLPFTALYCGPR